MPTKYLVQLDRTPHGTKPKGAEVGAITRRLQNSDPAEVTCEELGAAILSGATWCSACYKPNAGGWGEFVSQQLFALDIDNAAQLDPLAAIHRCKSIGVEPLMIYFTFSATSDNPRYRLIIAAPDPIRSEAWARLTIGGLLDMFPEADQACRNCNRLWYGGVEVVNCEELGI